MPRTLLKKYLSKNLENVAGAKLGKIIDAVFSKKNGKIIAFIVKLSEQGRSLKKFPPAEGDTVMIPYPFFIFSEIRIILKEDEVQKFLDIASEGELGDDLE